MQRLNNSNVQRLTLRAGIQKSLAIMLAALAWLAWPGAARADEGVAATTKTLSPYFFVAGTAKDVENFPLLATKVRVAVTAAIAEVVVTQEYVNRGQHPINAEYVFPASTRAAVNGLRMKVGDQLVEAVIKERAAARRDFEQAKRRGSNAALLEQQRPNVFTLAVANIMPGDNISVELRYTELLVPTAGVYEFVYPTVTGPRYSNEPDVAPGATHWVKSPYLPKGSPKPANFEIEASIASGLPLQAFACASHKLRETWDKPTLLRVALDTSEQNAGNRDVVLRYRLAGNAIQSGLTLFDAGSEKFFMLNVEPPARVTPAAIPAREYVFIVDVSGSMAGFPLDTAKELLRKLTADLRPHDTFNVLLFSGGSTLLAPQSLPASSSNLEQALRVLANEQGGGGTELLPALQQALALPHAPGTSRHFVIISDGYVTVEREAFDFVRANLGGASMYAFGIGSSVNRYLIEGLAKAGLAEAFVVTSPAEAGPAAQRFAEYVKAPIMTGISVSYAGFQAYAVEPASIPDMLAERPLVIHGKWRGPASGTISVRGITGTGTFQQNIDVAQVAPLPENRALTYLWARTRVANLADFGVNAADAAERAEIIKLGLQYSLLTEFTSFVAVSQRIRNSQGQAETVAQPLALPLGVSESAVGGGVQGAPEPGLVGLLSAVLGIWLVNLLRRQRRERAACPQ